MGRIATALCAASCWPCPSDRCALKQREKNGVGLVTLITAGPVRGANAQSDRGKLKDGRFIYFYCSKGWQVLVYCNTSLLYPVSSICRYSVSNVRARWHAVCGGSDTKMGKVVSIEGRGGLG